MGPFRVPKLKNKTEIFFFCVGLPKILDLEKLGNIFNSRRHFRRTTKSPIKHLPGEKI